MKKLFVFISLLMVLVSCDSSNEPSERVVGYKKIELSPDERSASNALNEFSIKLFSEAVKDENLYDSNGNFAISPISAEICISMIANSGDKAMEEKLVEIFGFSDIETLKATIGHLIKSLPFNLRQSKYCLANSIWYDKELSSSEAWQEEMRSTFISDIRSADMSSAETVKEINAWCSENTNRLINNIIGATDGLKLLALNASYFNGQWKDPFDSKLTKTKEFFGTKGNTKVSMMHQKLKLDYFYNEDFELVYKPFEGNTTMILVLPKEGVDIMEMASTMTLSRLKESLNTIDKSEIMGIDLKVDLQLPKFRISAGGNLSTSLYNLGFPSVTTLDKMGNDCTVPVGFGQVTTIAVDEKGVETASVSSGMIGAKQSGEIQMNFNRPFMYFIENSQTGTILVAGIVQNL